MNMEYRYRYKVQIVIYFYLLYTKKFYIYVKNIYVNFYIVKICVFNYTKYKH